MSKEASISGNYAENLVLGHLSNHNNLIDDIDLKLEIKSCLVKHKSWRKYPLNPSTRHGCFKISIIQHRELLRIDGYYLFIVLDDKDVFKIKKIRAVDIEERFKFTERKITKHYYYSLNWKKAFEVDGLTINDVITEEKENG